MATLPRYRRRATRAISAAPWAAKAQHGTSPTRRCFSPVTNHATSLALKSRWMAVFTSDSPRQLPQDIQLSDDTGSAAVASPQEI
ncbi:protein of unknown function (plasmid) [Cupriavidus taiwanensis]|uniref:Uncharacterized protein n=1 Tax=Cupriavidus taiwanensis TaxID=164546 RepID=A0A9Q7UXV6_9BURK|nr:protein of unknown function [Cupriavidus taiwanensis]